MNFQISGRRTVDYKYSGLQNMGQWVYKTKAQDVIDLSGHLFDA